VPTSSSIYSGTMRFWGLGSGLDVDDIVGKLMDVERIPLERLKQQKQLLEWKQEAYRNLHLKLKELDDAAFSMTLSTTYNPSAISSSNTNVVTATAGTGAPEGTYTLVVERLADAAHFYSEQLASTEVTDVSFTIERLGDTGASKTFSFTSGTIHDVVKQINSSNLDLQAFYDNDLQRLFITSKNTGSDAEYRFTDITGEFISSQLKLQHTAGDVQTAVDASAGNTASYKGVDAQFTLNGVSGLTKTSNQFTINGVAFNLQAVSANPVTIKVSRDIDAVVNSIKSFVDMYNEVIKEIDTKLSEKRYYDYQPLTEAQKEELSEKEIEKWEEKARSGLLRSDSVLNRMLSDLRSALTNSVSDTGSNFDMLAAIGIKTGNWSEKGKLFIDEPKLRASLTENLEGVIALFTKAGDTAQTKGVAIRFNEALDKSLEQLGRQGGNAIAALDNSLLGKQMKGIDKQIEVMEARLERIQAAYYRQFSALESYSSQMYTQGAWLSQTFGGMNQS
jgi:flagellar hook-associated protein 2